MDLSRSRTLYFAALFALVALSLRPQVRVEKVLDLAFAPTRVLSELLLPLRALRSSSVRAAEHAIAQHVDDERARSLALLAAERARAEPVDPTLRAGRAWIHAEVVGQSAGSVPAAAGDRADGSIAIRCAPGAPLEVGLPVVCGDTYVGRIASLGARASGEARVTLITADAFRVGGRVAFAPSAPEATEPRAALHAQAQIVAGGLAVNPVEDPAGIYIAVRAPSERDLAHGTVRAGELGRGDAPAALAEGFRLGELVRYSVNGVPVLALRADLDYERGLAQVVVLAPPSRAIPEPVLLGGRFGAEHWIPARFALAGDPSHWRDSRVLCAGRRDKIEPRAVVAVGARYLGSVVTVGEFSSEVALLGDPGLSIKVLASARNGSEAQVPLPLGRMTSIGRDRSSGEILLRWDAPIPVLAANDPRASVPALLFTGSGDPDVPAGLWLGETDLPRGRGPFVLRVRVAGPVAGLQTVHVLRKTPPEAKP